MAMVEGADEEAIVRIESVTSVAVVTPDASASRALYVDALGLPLGRLDGDYVASEEIAGCRHFVSGRLRRPRRPVSAYARGRIGWSDHR